MNMPGGSTELIEVADLAVGLLNLFKGSGSKDSSSQNGVAGKGATEVLVDALKLSLKSFGVGNYDEAEFAKLFGRLNPDEMMTWTKILHHLSSEERKALQLRVYLMNPSGSFETEVIDATKSKDGVITAPQKTITRPCHPDADVRMQFMRSIIATARNGGDDGPRIVADMLRTNEVIGNTNVVKSFQATTQRLVDELNKQLIELNRRFPAERKTVKMSLIGRFFNLLIIGPKKMHGKK